ncbi:hypothetical protein CPB86DRAFT_779540 [Serendipita vermifera]|nr:hypothetical protein CPB86DRAFT_779540 [Serendipita vermifera]
MRRGKLVEMSILSSVFKGAKVSSRRLNTTRQPDTGQTHRSLLHLSSLASASLICGLQTLNKSRSFVNIWYHWYPTDSPSPHQTFLTMYRQDDWVVS